MEWWRGGKRVRGRDRPPLLPSPSQADHAPYALANFTWVPGCTGDMVARLPVPVIALYGRPADDARARADPSATTPASPQLATLDAAMAAVDDANSTACLAGGRCAPVGGHSVWGAVPPLGVALPPGNASSVPPTVLLTAPADARQLLHGGSAGAGALGGLIAALAAGEALANATRAPGAPPLPGRFIVAALAGERWGYVGSRRLLFEARARSAAGPPPGPFDDAAGGFPLANVTLLIDIGPVGDAGKRGNASEAPTLWVHPGTAPGSAAAAAAAAAAATAGGGVSAAVRPANMTPGPPPGALWPFAAALPALPSIALSSHAATLGGPLWASRWDDARRLDAGAVAAAASAAARAVAGALGVAALAANATPAALTPRVDELLACIATKDPGLASCRLARELLGARGAAAAAVGGGPHHAGPIATITADPQSPDPAAKSGYALFLWEFWARGLAAGPAGGACRSRKECGAGAACAGLGGAGGGHCMPVTVAYVAAYPLELECAGCDGGAAAAAWRPTNATAPWRNATALPPGAVWAESNWAAGVPRLDMYRAEGAGVAATTFWGGAAATLAAGALAARAAAAAARATADPVWW